MGESIKTYKGFNKDMTCRDFQYEEGKEYAEESVEVCDHGFHACEYPLDCLHYYSPNESVYHEVEQSGEIQKHNDDTKVASTKIKIGAEISIAGLVKAAIEYTVKRVNKDLGNRILWSILGNRHLWSILGNRIQGSILGNRRLWSILGNRRLWSILGNRHLWSILGNRILWSILGRRQGCSSCCLGLQIKSQGRSWGISCFCRLGIHWLKR